MRCIVDTAYTAIYCFHQTSFKNMHIFILGVYVINVIKNKSFCSPTTTSSIATLLSMSSNTLSFWCISLVVNFHKQFKKTDVAKLLQQSKPKKSRRSDNSYWRNCV